MWKDAFNTHVVRAGTGHSTRPGKSLACGATSSDGEEHRKACCWSRFMSQGMEDEQKSVHPSLPQVAHKWLSSGTCPDSQSTDLCTQHMLKTAPPLD